MTAALERRLDEVEDALTPLQHVLAHIADGRRAGSFVAMGKLWADKPHRESDTPMARIGRSIEAQMKGKPAVEVNRAVRRAQMQMKYLAYLFHDINAEVAESESEWTYRGGFLALAVKCAEDDAALDQAADGMLSHWFDLERTRRAIAIIERVEFAGASILLPKERRLLDEFCDRASRSRNVIVENVGETFSNGENVPDVDERAMSTADAWRELAKAKVLGQFGKTDVASEYAARVVLNKPCPAP